LLLSRFLLSKGREEEALAVLHKIAAFNKAPVPELTMDDFRLLDQQQDVSFDSAAALNPAAGTVQKRTTKEQAKHVVTRSIGQFKHLKGLFGSPKMIWLTVSIALSYVRLLTCNPSDSSSSPHRHTADFTLPCRSRCSSRSVSREASFR
jgi:hypothetical protein